MHENSHLAWQARHSSPDPGIKESRDTLSARFTWSSKLDVR
jgi:hypothetical protein